MVATTSAAHPRRAFPVPVSPSLGFLWSLSSSRSPRPRRRRRGRLFCGRGSRAAPGLDAGVVLASRLDGRAVGDESGLAAARRLLDGRLGVVPAADVPPVVVVRVLDAEPDEEALAAGYLGGLDVQVVVLPAGVAGRHH